MKTQSLIILIIAPLILACSRLDDPTNTTLISDDLMGTENNRIACEIPDDLLPENDDSSPLQVSIKINDEDFYVDGTPDSVNGIFNFGSSEFTSNNNIKISFDLSVSQNFQNRDVFISGTILIQNESSETQSLDLEFKTPVISDGTIGTSYSGNISMFLSDGEIQSIDNQNLWSMFTGCDLFSLSALPLNEPITTNENPSISLGTYAFGQEPGSKLDGENLVKEIGFRVRFKLSAGASVSLSSFLGAHRELAP